MRPEQGRPLPGRREDGLRNDGLRRLRLRAARRARAEHLDDAEGVRGREGCTSWSQKGRRDIRARPIDLFFQNYAMTRGNLPMPDKRCLRHAPLEQIVKRFAEVRSNLGVHSQEFVPS